MSTFDAEAPDPFTLFLRGLVLNLLSFLLTTVVFGLVVALVVLLQRAGFDLFSLVWLGVLPIGAFVIGLFIAFGFYKISIVLEVKPTAWTALFSVLLAVMAAGAIHYSHYVLFGGAAGDFRTFLAWLDGTLRHMKFGVTIYGYEVGGAAGGPEMGLWGYGAAFFQVLALAAGGLLPLAFLWERPYCLEDRKFYKTLLKPVLRFGGSGREAEGLRGAEEGSRGYFDKVRALPPGDSQELEWELYRCPKCAKETLVERVFEVKEGKRVPWTIKHRVIRLARGRSVETEVGSFSLE